MVRSVLLRTSSSCTLCWQFRGFHFRIVARHAHDVLDAAFEHRDPPAAPCVPDVEPPADATDGEQPPVRAECERTHLCAAAERPRERRAVARPEPDRSVRAAGFRALDHWLRRNRIGSGAKPDDILDACALALAARNFHASRVLPRGRATKDTRGLKMQIWY